MIDRTVNRIIIFIINKSYQKSSKVKYTNKWIIIMILKSNSLTVSLHLGVILLCQFLSYNFLMTKLYLILKQYFLL